MIIPLIAAELFPKVAIDNQDVKVPTCIGELNLAVEFNPSWPK